MGAILKWGAAAVVLLAVLGWFFQEEILLKAIEIAADRRTPVGPHREVSWQTGADPAGRAPGERPPNIVLILADDLGFNDLSFAGGGVAGGSVPTPHIDSIARPTGPVLPHARPSCRAATERALASSSPRRRPA
jgi:uncharacterized sulfatase